MNLLGIYVFYLPNNRAVGNKKFEYLYLYEDKQQ
jgi:hypothetical protein